jgi:hypothetical protein
MVRARAPAHSHDAETATGRVLLRVLSHLLPREGVSSPPLARPPSLQIPREAKC